MNFKCLTLTRFYLQSIVTAVFSTRKHILKKVGTFNTIYLYWFVACRNLQVDGFCIWTKCAKDKFLLAFNFYRMHTKDREYVSVSSVGYGLNFFDFKSRLFHIFWIWLINGQALWELAGISNSF